MLTCLSNRYICTDALIDVPFACNYVQCLMSQMVFFLFHVVKKSHDVFNMSACKNFNIFETIA